MSIRFMTSLDARDRVCIRLLLLFMTTCHKAVSTVFKVAHGRSNVHKCAPAVPEPASTEA